MKQVSRVLVIFTLFMGAHSAIGQEASVPEASTISKAMNLRDQSAGIWYARFEIVQEGPAHIFNVADAEYGQIYRYRSIEEWWTDGRRCAVAIGTESESYLDDVLVAQTPASPEPRQVYVHDGVATTLIDFTVPGRKMVVNGPWPFESAAIPVLFGRSFSMRSYGDVVSGNSAVMRRENYRGQPCSVMDWTEGHTRVETWLAEKLEFLSVREVAYVNEILVVDRAFDFKTTPAGFRYASDAVERYVTNDGSESVKTWRVLEFRKSPKLPFFVFAPTEDDVAWVVDQASGAVLKGPERKD